MAAIVETGLDRSICVWNVSNGELLAHHKHKMDSGRELCDVFFNSRDELITEDMHGRGFDPPTRFFRRNPISGVELGKLHVAHILSAGPVLIRQARAIAIASENTVEIFDDTLIGKRRSIPCKNISSLAAAPDGKRLAIGTSRGEVLFLNLENDKLSDPIKIGKQGLWQIVWSGDGALFTTIADDGRLSTLRTDGSMQASTTDKAPLPIGCAFTKDNTEMVIVGSDRNLTLLSAADHSVRATRKVDKKCYVSLSRDGKYLVIESAKGELIITSAELKSRDAD
ncbi:MAG TPA: WD40 repeat domain-containing protein [Pirellulales bacterium]